MSELIGMSLSGCVSFTEIDVTMPWDFDLEATRSKYV